MAAVFYWVFYMLPLLPSPELQSACLERLLACCLQAEQRLGHRISCPRLSFRQRGKAAGTARLREQEIRLNPILLAENPDVFLQEVIPHELAHLIVWQRYGRTAPHGREWQAIMRDVFELPLRVTHSLDIRSVQSAEFAYVCACQTHQLSLRRHNKVQRGEQRYLCRQCGTELKRQG